MVKKFIAFLILWCSVLLFTACVSQKSVIDINGDWYNDSNCISVRKDGTYKSTFEYGSGKWKILNDKTTIEFIDFYGEVNEVILDKDEKGEYFEYHGRKFYRESVSVSEPQNSSTTLKVESNKLSDTCQYILASGYDGDNNYYELVATEEENYKGKIVNIGVIKNNKWKISLSCHTPFNNKDGLLLNNRDIERTIYDFKYVGNGCFLFRNSWDCGHCLWNANINKFFNEKYYYLEYSHGEESICNNDGMFLFNCYNQHGNVTSFCKLVNSNTMEVTDVFEGNFLCFADAPFSEGKIGYAEYGKNEKNGFYNIDGEKVIDLSEYFIMFCGIFKNGKSNIKIKNNANTVYLLTIDDTGKIIESVEVDE